MTPDEQLELWCKGISVHDYDNDQCCPDFSCCHPELLAPVEQRILFRDRPELRDSLLIGFLTNLLSDKNMHVAGSIQGVA